MSYAEWERRTEQLNALRDIGKALVEIRIELEALRNSVVLLGKEPVVKTAEEIPLSDVGGPVITTYSNIGLKKCKKSALATSTSLTTKANPVEKAYDILVRYRDGDDMCLDIEELIGYLGEALE